MGRLSDRRGGHRDRAVGRAPVLTAESWAQPAKALEELRSWAIDAAQDAVNWYQRDKGTKRKASRILRGASIVFAAIGGVVPQLGSLGLPMPNQEFRIGYVAFALAAACIAFDYFFGLSSGWMRDVSAAQSIQTMIREFDLEWLSQSMRLAGGAVTNEVIASFLLTIRTLLMSVEEVVSGKTAEWAREFSRNIKTVQPGLGESSATAITGSGSR
jgi:SMODS and SLOG-associating 2TM effector domain 2